MAAVWADYAWMPVADMVCTLQVKMQAANMFLMAQKPVPGSNEQVLYITAAVPTVPAPTQLLLEVSMPLSIA